MKLIGNYLTKRWSLYLIIVFYLVGGLNHFINPDFYIPLIPPYFPFPEFINYASGIAEILLSIGLAVSKTTKLASYLTVVMLIAFIPSHIYYIQMGSCINDGLCTPEWMGWIRLIIIHPLLIYWVWMIGKSADK